MPSPSPMRDNATSETRRRGRPPPPDAPLPGTQHPLVGGDVTDRSCSGAHKAGGGDTPPPRAASAAPHATCGGSSRAATAQRHLRRRLRCRHRPTPSAAAARTPPPRAASATPHVICGGGSHAATATPSAAAARPLPLRGASAEVNTISGGGSRAATAHRHLRRQLASRHRALGPLDVVRKGLRDTYHWTGPARIRSSSQTLQRVASTITGAREVRGRCGCGSCCHRQRASISAEGPITGFGIP